MCRDLAGLKGLPGLWFPAATRSGFYSLTVISSGARTVALPGL